MLDDTSSCCRLLSIPPSCTAWPALSLPVQCMTIPCSSHPLPRCTNHPRSGCCTSSCGRFRCMAGCTRNADTSCVPMMGVVHCAMKCLKSASIPPRPHLSRAGVPSSLVGRLLLSSFSLPLAFVPVNGNFRSKTCLVVVIRRCHVNVRFVGP